MIYRFDKTTLFWPHGTGPRRPVRRALRLGCLSLVLSSTACFLLRPELPSRSFRSMGGRATVTLGTAYSDRIEPVTAQVHTILARLEWELSTYRPDSAISLLAERAGVAPLAVSEEAFRVLSLGKHFGELSDGAFDITVAPLVRLWGLGRTPEPAGLPSEETIREQLRLVDYDAVLI